MGSPQANCTGSTDFDTSIVGARVILACRNLVAANKAADEIKQITGGQGCSKVVVKHLDLASLTSVRRFVKDMKNSETRLDILINNAGM